MLKNASIWVSTLLKSLGVLWAGFQTRLFQQLVTFPKTQQICYNESEWRSCIYDSDFDSKNALSPKVFYQTKSFEQTCICTESLSLCSHIGFRDVPGFIKKIFFSKTTHQNGTISYLKIGKNYGDTSLFKWFCLVENFWR